VAGLAPCCSPPRPSPPLPWPAPPADGTATTTLNPVTGDRNWDSAIWTWVGDTGGQVFPATARRRHRKRGRTGLHQRRTLNITTNTTSLTIGSFTLQQVENGFTRALNVNGSSSGLTLSTNLIQHVDAPGVTSTGGGVTGLTNALIFNSRVSLVAGDLVLNANTNPLSTIPSVNPVLGTDNGNIALKFDDCNISFNNLTTRGVRHIEFEDNGTTPSVWNMNGAINLEGSGELRVRYRAINAAGDLVAGTTGLTTLHANASASGDGFARFLLQRATGQRDQPRRLQRPPSWTPTSTSAATTATSASATSRSTPVPRASSGSTARPPPRRPLPHRLLEHYRRRRVRADLHRQQQHADLRHPADEHAGRRRVVDNYANFNASGAMAPRPSPARTARSTSQLHPGRHRLIEVRDRGIVKATPPSSAPSPSGTNLTLAPGAIIAHENFPAGGASPVQNLGTGANYYWASATTQARPPMPTQPSARAPRGPASPTSAPLAPGSAGRSPPTPTSPSAAAATPRTARAARRSSSATAPPRDPSSSPTTPATPRSTSRSTAESTSTTPTPTTRPSTSAWSTAPSSASTAPTPRAVRRSRSNPRNPDRLEQPERRQRGVQRPRAPPNRLDPPGQFEELCRWHSGLIGTGTFTREPNIVFWPRTTGLTGTQFGGANLTAGDVLRMDVANLVGLARSTAASPSRSRTPTVRSTINLNGGIVMNDARAAS
jgi:hypothetical protein